MAPSRKTAQDDSSSSSKNPAAQSGRANGKKAVSNLVNGAGSTLKETATLDGDDSGTLSASESKGLSWSTEDISNLQSYRWANRLAVSSPFTHPSRQALLTNPGIGQRSPTAIAKKRKRKENGEKTITKTTSPDVGSHVELANAVRRHFNSQPAEESAAIAGLLYTVRNQGMLDP